MKDKHSNLTEMPIFARTDRLLPLMPWNACNFACAHCANESGPKSQEFLPRDVVSRLIREARSAFGESWRLSLSGGEPFLHAERLLEICTEASNAGALVDVMTNGYWGANGIECARAQIAALKKVGLRGIGVSYDSFHKRFVAPASVANIIRACTLEGVRVAVKCVATADFRLHDALRELNLPNPRFVEFIELPLTPSGRAECVSKERLLPDPEMVRSPCRGQQLTIAPDGCAHACCNGGGQNLILGNALRDSLASLLYRFATDPVLTYIRTRSPFDCIALMPETIKTSLENGFYVDECHLCHTIFSNPEMASAVKDAINALFIEEVSRGIEVKLRGGLSPTSPPPDGCNPST